MSDRRENEGGLVNAAELKKLKDAASSAALEARTLRSQWEDRGRELVEIERARIKEELRAQYSSRYEELLKLQVQTQRDYERAAVEFASAGEGAPYPVGTKLVHWKNEGRGYSIVRDMKLIPSGLTGVIEVATPTSEYVGSSWNRPEVGAFILRHLKKDGSPAKKCEKTSGWEFSNRWFPEGVDPNEKKAAS